MHIEVFEKKATQAGPQKWAVLALPDKVVVLQGTASGKAWKQTVIPKRDVPDAQVVEEVRHMRSAMIEKGYRSQGPVSVDPERLGLSADDVLDAGHIDTREYFWSCEPARASTFESFNQKLCEAASNTTFVLERHGLIQERFGGAEDGLTVFSFVNADTGRHWRFRIGGETEAGTVDLNMRGAGCVSMGTGLGTAMFLLTLAEQFPEFSIADDEENAVSPRITNRGNPLIATDRIEEARRVGAELGIAIAPIDFSALSKAEWF